MAVVTRRCVRFGRYNTPCEGAECNHWVAELGKCVFGVNTQEMDVVSAGHDAMHAGIVFEIREHNRYEARLASRGNAGTGAGGRRWRTQTFQP